MSVMATVHASEATALEIEPAERRKVPTAPNPHAATLAVLKAAEAWRPVVGHEGFYEVSDRGRVRAVNPGGRWNALPAGRIVGTHDGVYPRVSLTKPDGRVYTERIHGLVLTAFVGARPDGCVCRHLDGNHNNNDLTNLTWGTQAENVADAIAHGVQQRGERNGLSKLTERDALEIRRLAVSGTLTHKAIGRRFGVTRQTVGDIANGRRWRYLWEAAA